MGDEGVPAGGSWKADPAGADFDGTRSRVVSIAADIIRESGVAALRLDDVAARLGMHRSSVYRYVDSKEALVTAVLVQSAHAVAESVMAELDPDDPVDLLVTGVARSLGALADDPVHQAIQEPGASSAVARMVDSALVEGIRPLVEPMIEAAEAAGVLRQGVTADDAVTWLMVVAAGLRRHPGLVDGDGSLEQLLTRMLLPALLEPMSWVNSPSRWAHSGAVGSLWAAVPDAREV